MPEQAAQDISSVDLWRDDFRKAIDAFREVAKLAGFPESKHEFEIEWLGPNQHPPARLPAGKVAVYGFWGDGEWLKVGHVGPKSNARYTMQHYSPGSAGSTLAKSLQNDNHMRNVAGFDPKKPGEWVKSSTHRVNIVLPEAWKGAPLALLEAFLHVCLRPRYEGRTKQRQANPKPLDAGEI